MERGASGKKHAVFYLMFHNNTFISPAIMSTFPSLNIRNIKKINSNKQRNIVRYADILFLNAVTNTNAASLESSDHREANYFPSTKSIHVPLFSV